MADLDKDEWTLNKIAIEFNTYGEDKGKYTGNVSFSNGHYESFSFRVRPNMAHDYIKLIAGDVVLAASTLGESLIKSLGKTMGNDKLKLEKSE